MFFERNCRRSLHNFQIFDNFFFKISLYLLLGVFFLLSIFGLESSRFFLRVRTSFADGVLRFCRYLVVIPQEGDFFLSFS